MIYKSPWVVYGPAYGLFLYFIYYNVAEILVEKSTGLFCEFGYTYVL